MIDGDPELLLQTLVMPGGDIVLLMLLSGVLAVVWRSAGLDVAALAVGMVAFVCTDLLFALQLSRGQYVDGGPLDLGWVLAQSCLSVAACLPSRRHGSARLDGVVVLVVPGVSAVAALGLICLSTWRPISAVSVNLALLAVTAALARTVLTFGEIQALADSRREARTDDVTGLRNMRGFLEDLAQIAGPQARDADSAVLLLDLDRFKEINDLYGHAVGNQVLKAVGDRLALAVRAQDVVGRLDGDTFAVLAHRLSAAEAQELAQRLRAAIQKPLAFGGATRTTRSLTGGVGVAVTSAHVRTGAELLQLADLAMNASKARRAGVLLYDHERDGQGRHRAAMIEELRLGLERGELVMHYQPKLDLRSGRVGGVEALVRWRHPSRGLLYPDAFVSLAETAGLMPRLTSTVLDVALAQARRWRESGLQLTVAVNVSASDLTEPTLPQLVGTLLHRHGVPPDSLVIEVTEDLLIADRRNAVEVLERLSRTGVTIAIDDYGTGYSSLAYLADLPVDELKLDRSLVSAVTTHPRTHTIVTSTIQLAHALGLTVTAEGIEDEATLTALKQHGCDVAQGYLIGRPVPPEELAGLDEGRPTRATPVRDAAEVAGTADDAS